MAGIKEIRGKISSVQNTRKITKAMEMVAASKMRRAQERMKAARPYAHKVRDIIAHISEANPEYYHPFMVKNTGKRTVGIIAVTTDKGLCGSMNTNMLRALVQKFKNFSTQGIKTESTVIGSKGIALLSSCGSKILSQVTQLGDTPHLGQLIGAIKIQLDRYSQGKLLAVYIAYTRFIHTMKQEPVIEQLLPLTNERFEKNLDADVLPKSLWDYIYEPDAKLVIDDLMVCYVETLVYQAVVENIASEQSARMVAMRAASDNANTVINDLQLVYNKGRQAAITKELSEIISGAAAI
ncbi:F0F1 ATP synthase subunit gamma [Candidatus Vallotia tarda]|nr:F0F1 ATP synthase subunit gamma [Candidatus Vallotia tarda]